MEALPEKAKRFFTEQNFVVLDTETTGKDTWSAEIVEIVILDHQGVPLLNTLVKPTCAIPQGAQAIHGITDEMVVGAPSFPELFPTIVNLLKDKVCIVYNAEYDIPLLESVAKRHGFKWYCESGWCLMKAYADYRKTPGRYGNYKWHRLGDACEQQRVVLTDAHRALGDTLATWALLKKLAESEI